MSNYEFRTVPVRGGELAVGVWGPADAAHTVLAVHGVTSSHLSWPLVAAALEGVRIIAPDLRGRGRSNQLPGPYGMPQHADDLAAVLDAFGVEQAVVIGHSMGAFVSVVLSHRHPNRVAELVLVDGGLPLFVPEGIAPDDLTKAVLGPAQERLTMTFDSVNSYLDFWRVHPAFADDWTETIDNYVAYDLYGEAPELHPATVFQAVAEDSAELTGSDSLMNALTALTHRATFLRSPRGLMNADPLYEPEYVAQWAQKLPTITTRDVENVNHYTIVLGEVGATAVAAAAQEALARQESKTRTTA